ncbi:MAG: hypothetical protein ABEH81_10810 [Halopenitus sp.]
MEPTREDRAQFRELLMRLKHRGCNLLVVGETDPSVRRRASRRLFGAPLASRTRLLVTVGDVTPDRWLPAEGSVVDAGILTRGSPVDVREDSFRATLAEKIADVDAAPGECRVSVTSIAPLLDDAECRPTLDAIREAVVDVNGMGHYHLAASIDTVQERGIDDEFDAVLELRRDGDAQERWHVPSRNLITPWVPMEP